MYLAHNFFDTTISRQIRFKKYDAIIIDFELAAARLGLFQHTLRSIHRKYAPLDADFLMQTSKIYSSATKNIQHRRAR